MLINQKAVKAFCNERDKQATQEFLSALDQAVMTILIRSCRQFNGNRKKLSASILAMVGLRGME